jgi:hypothetical protein
MDLWKAKSGVEKDKNIDVLEMEESMQELITKFQEMRDGIDTGTDV